MAVLQQMLLAGKKQPVDIVFTDEDYLAAGTSSSFTVDIGTAAADRIVVVCVQVTNNTGSGFATTTVLTVTLDGNSMTRIVEAGVGNRNGGIFMLAVPAGTTATLVTSRGSNATHKVAVYAVYNAVGVVDSEVVNLSGGDVSVDVSEGGGVIAMGCTQGDGTPAYTFTGVNEDVDYVISAGSFGSGHNDNLAAASPRSVTVAAGGVGGVAASASFR